MKERLKQLRKEELKLSQQKIAEEINITQSAYASYEIGRVTPPDRTITDICEKFNVNEKWLRTGEPPIFKEMSELEQMKKTIDEVMESKSEFVRNALYVLATMTPEEWDIIERKFYEIKQFSKNKRDL